MPKLSDSLVQVGSLKMGSLTSIIILLCIFYLNFILILRASQTTFSIELDEEVAVVNTFSNTGCFNLSASQGNSTEGEVRKQSSKLHFKLFNYIVIILFKNLTFPLLHTKTCNSLFSN